jgi:Transglycosylase-like domain
MPVFPKRLNGLAVAALVALVTCGSPRVQVVPPSTERVSNVVVVDSGGHRAPGAVRVRDVQAWTAAVNVQRVLDAAVFIEAAKDVQQVAAGSRPSLAVDRNGRGGDYTPATPAVRVVGAGIRDGVLASVMTCIKDHESGNYAESSHPGSGSGAYQFVPGTWRTWSARAGHGGYAYAYEAPPAVQDAVLEYTLTHGGAGNWSNKFGNDPCTQGMGG